MNVPLPPVRNDLSDDWCGAMLSFCAEPGNGAPASGCFRWYEQDSCDEVTQEALAWASIEETIWPQPEECLVPARASKTACF